MNLKLLRRDPATHIGLPYANDDIVRIAKEQAAKELRLGIVLSAGKSIVNLLDILLQHPELKIDLNLILGDPFGKALTRQESLEQAYKVQRGLELPEKCTPETLRKDVRTRIQELYEKLELYMRMHHAQSSQPEVWLRWIDAHVGFPFIQLTAMEPKIDRPDDSASPEGNASGEEPPEEPEPNGHPPPRIWFWFGPYPTIVGGKSYCLLRADPKEQEGPSHLHLLRDYRQDLSEIVTKEAYGNLRNYPLRPELPKLVSIDLDHTLLGGWKDVVDDHALDRIEGILLQLKDQGIITVICTGRGRSFVESLLTSRYAACFDYYLLENGAIVCEDLKGCDNLLVESTGAVFLERDWELIRYLRKQEACIKRRDRGRGKYSHEPGKEIGLTIDFARWPRGTSAEIMFNRIKAKYEQLYGPTTPGMLPDGIIDYSAPSPPGTGKVDFGLPGRSKLTALHYILLRNPTIKPEDVLHVGDSENDRELLEETGWVGVVRVRHEDGEDRVNPSLARLVESRRESGLSPDRCCVATMSNTAGLSEVLEELLGMFLVKDSGLKSSNGRINLL